MSIIRCSADLESRDLYQERAKVYPKYAGNYGEYVTLTSSLQLSYDEVYEKNTYWLFVIEGPKTGVDITLESYFQLHLPTPGSFPNEEDVNS